MQRRKPGFINEYFDDNLWWALAWVAACDLTGDERYLAAAQAIFAHSLSGWDDTCGGGLWWNEDRGIQERDHQRAVPDPRGAARRPGTRQREYRDWALREWEWLRGSGLIGPSGLVNDGLTAACANNGGTTWTYNQGVILGGLAALHELTGDQAYLRQGEAIADAALRALTGRRGILAEPCEPAGCDGDQTQFKGIFVRYLHEFSRHGGKPAVPGVHPGQRRLRAGQRRTRQASSGCAGRARSTRRTPAGRRRPLRCSSPPPPSRPSACAISLARCSHSGPAVSHIPCGRAWRGSPPLTAVMTAASSRETDLPCVLTSAPTAWPAAWSIATEAENPPVPPL